MIKPVKNQHKSATDFYLVARVIGKYMQPLYGVVSHKMENVRQISGRHGEAKGWVVRHVKLWFHGWFSCDSWNFPTTAVIKILLPRCGWNITVVRFKFSGCPKTIDRKGNLRRRRKKIDGWRLFRSLKANVRTVQIELNVFYARKVPNALMLLCLNQ